MNLQELLNEFDRDSQIRVMSELLLEGKGRADFFSEEHRVHLDSDEVSYLLGYVLAAKQFVPDEQKKAIDVVAEAYRVQPSYSVIFASSGDPRELMNKVASIDRKLKS